VCRRVCAATNVIAPRLRTTAIGVFPISALVNAWFGFATILPYGIVVALALAAGFIVQGNFSNLISELLTVADSHFRGTTVAVYSCIDFAGDWLSDTARIAAWVMAFGICAAACCVGGIASTPSCSLIGGK